MRSKFLYLFFLLFSTLLLVAGCSTNGGNAGAGIGL